MKKPMILVALGFIITGCLSGPRLGTYFPNLAFSQCQDHHDFRINWYGKHLRSMEEPSLLVGLRAQTNSTSWRLTFLPTFMSPMCYRFYVPDTGECYMVVKRTNGRGGYETGSLILNERKPLDRTRFAQLDLLLKDLSFWSVPVNGPPEIVCLDGEEYILEVADHGRYHVITRTSPGSYEPDYTERFRKSFPAVDIDSEIKSEQKYVNLVNELVKTAGVPLYANQE